MPQLEKDGREKSAMYSKATSLDPIADRDEWFCRSAEKAKKKARLPIRRQFIIDVTR